jgi:hypothetical protein
LRGDHAQTKTYSAMVIQSNPIALAHDPEKWAPVFPRDKRATRLRGDHAQTKTYSAMVIQSNPIAL